MTDAKQLFDKSPDELREAFVRNRFEKERYYRSDIEAWLMQQRMATLPDSSLLEDSERLYWNMLLWSPHMMGAAEHHPISILTERATTLSAMRGVRCHQPVSWTDRVDGAQFSAPFAILARCDIQLYVGYDQAAIIIVLDGEGVPQLYQAGMEDRDGSPQLVISGSKRTHNRSTSTMDVLFAEWHHQRPKWREARAFLCDALAEEIRRERAKAEHDFDTAVAVSADGTKIVHADWVVVTGIGMVTRGHPRYGQTTEERLRVIPCAAFRDRKILRSEKYIRIDPYSPSDSFPLRKDFSTLPVESQIARVLRRAEHPSLLNRVRSEERQMFVRLSVLFGLENDKPARWKIDLRTTVLITDVRHCPSPLPDGGVEVTA